MSRKKVRCEVCAYRNTYNFDVFKCNYFTVTGCTRGAVPPEKCTHFRKGEVIKAPPKPVPIPQPKPKTRKKRWKYDWDLASELWKQKKNDYEIGAALGCTHHRVYDWRKRNQLAANAPPGYRKKEEETT